MSRRNNYSQGLEVIGEKLEVTPIGNIWLITVYSSTSPENISNENIDSKLQRFFISEKLHSTHQELNNTCNNKNDKNIIPD